MSDKNDKSYIDEFIEAQENQYVQWKYPASGRATPFDEARGNARALGIMYCCGAVFMLGGALAVYLWGDSIPGFIFVLIAAVLFAGAAVGYFRKDKERKAYARKQAEIEKNKHKRKYRGERK